MLSFDRPGRPDDGRRTGLAAQSPARISAVKPGVSVVTAICDELPRGARIEDETDARLAELNEWYRSVVQ